ncbi:MAG: methylmalonyl Co-A mutase-associated GTPase MeaB [Bryobacterales bacterium]|nr:methylmalonyl Co-A mutase-associated GTPase MeaB [Bryobacterales bacterium]
MTGEAILRGDPRAVARAATARENQTAEGRELASALRAHAGRARVIGITGPPGAGKSTLVDQLTRQFRAQGQTVGIVAVDPTSPFTGGAILGDRVRMQSHHADAGVFIRSMATRGSLGGLARATEDLVTLLDASGRGVVLVETVGVGQSELAIAQVAPLVAVVLVPGMGDEVQAIKAGILEAADLFVINKADHPGAAQLERDLHSYLDDRPILKTVATKGTGVAELAARLLMLVPRPRALAALPAAGARIDHLGIAVSSIDAALGFWHSQLGLRVEHRETVAHEQVHVAMLPTGESRIELLEATSAESTIAKFIAKRGEGLHHVALRVADFDAAIERLRAAGARLLNEPRRGAGGHLYVFLHPSSAGGVLLELIKDESALPPRTHSLAPRDYSAAPRDESVPPRDESEPSRDREGADPGGVA